MKIAVYGICKNEAATVETWAASAADADYRFIADTGSADNSVELAKKAGVHGAKITVSPWRFDMAFNTALSLLPADMDICIPLGLDEVLEPGWRGPLEAAWVPGTTKAFVTYHHSPELTFPSDRPHARHGYIWRFPAHEATYPYMIPNPRSVNVPESVITHHQSKRDRSGYLALLKQGLDENPDNARMLHYYGRELTFCGRYKEAIPYLLNYFSGHGAFPGEAAKNRKVLIDACGKLEITK